MDSRVQVVQILTGQHAPGITASQHSAVVGGMGPAPQRRQSCGPSAGRRLRHHRGRPGGRGTAGLRRRLPSGHVRRPEGDWGGPLPARLSGNPRHPDRHAVHSGNWPSSGDQSLQHVSNSKDFARFRLAIRISVQQLTHDNLILLDTETAPGSISDIYHIAAYAITFQSHHHEQTDLRP